MIWVAVIILEIMTIGIGIVGLIVIDMITSVVLEEDMKDLEKMVDALAVEDVTYFPVSQDFSDFIF